MTEPRRRIDFPIPWGQPVRPCASCRTPIVMLGPGRHWGEKRVPLDLCTARAGRAESHFAYCPDADRFRRKKT